MLHETFDNCNECIKFQRDFIVSSHLFNFFFKKKVFILNNFLFSLQNLYRYSWQKMEYIIVYNFQVLITHLAIYQNREKSCMFFQKNLKKKKRIVIASTRSFSIAFFITISTSHLTLEIFQLK